MLFSHQSCGKSTKPPCTQPGPLGDHEGLFCFSASRQGEVVKTPQTQFSGSFPCSRFKLHLRILQPVKPVVIASRVLLQVYR